MSKALVAAVLAFALSGLVSCGHSCKNHERAQASKEFAIQAYKGGHFDQAKTLFLNSIEECSENYDARIGLANTCRSLGNEQYQAADQLLREGKMQQFERMYRDAGENHQLADQLFRTALSERPDDLDPHFGLGLFWYERSTSPISAPWPPGDAKNRQRERDEAIKEFTIVIERSPKLSSQSYRYRGIALLAADRVEDGARDIMVYHNTRQDLYNKIVAEPAVSEEAKRGKANRLHVVEKEIDDVREVIVLEHNEMLNRSLLLQKKDRTPEETQELAHLAAQQLVLEKMIKSWGLTKLGEMEQVLVRRCREYLETWNKGKLDDVLAFLAPRKGDELQLQQSITAKVKSQTRFSKVNFRSVVVDVETASVGFACEMVAPGASPPTESEVTVRWRLVGGQWLVTDQN